MRVNSSLSRLWQRQGRVWQLHLLLLLPIAWLLLFRYFPMYGAQIAFRDYQASRGIWGSPWVGLKYFRKFFAYYNCWPVIRNTLTLSLYHLAAGFPVPILLALLINSTRARRLGKTVQVVTYVPHFISTVVMVGIIVQFLSPDLGILARLLRAVGLGADRYLGDPRLFASIYVWSGVWQNAGWGSIVYLAALAGIDPQLHEAAIIDGASRVQRILHIDIPGILSTAVILLILSVGRVMDVGFEKVFLMQNPLNLQASEIISTYVYKVGLASQLPSYSYAAAIGLFNSLINLVLIACVNTAARRLGSTSLW